MFGLGIRFIDDFNIQLVIQFNYSVIANLHTHLKIISARYVFLSP
jgi:hypothetical protein